MNKIIHVLLNTNITTSIYKHHKDDIIKAFKNISSLLNNNPQMFDTPASMTPKTVNANGPRTWIPDKKRYEHANIHDEPQHITGGPRVHTDYILVENDEVRILGNKKTNKMVEKRRTIPITYPTGIGILPPPTNMPLVSDPSPTKPQKNQSTTLSHTQQSRQ